MVVKKILSLGEPTLKNIWQNTVKKTLCSLLLSPKILIVVATQLTLLSFLLDRLAGRNTLTARPLIC